MVTEHGFRAAAVVGAGLMGRRIAGVLAAGGMDVRLYDNVPEALDAAVREAAELAQTRAVGLGTAPGVIVGVAQLDDAIAGADFVTEAVYEDLALKQDLFERISRQNPTAVLATNTSVLPIGHVGERVAGRERLVGTHWWNPPDLVPIVEVILAEGTDETQAERVMKLLASVGKEPVLVRRDVPGFVGNRLQHALWREALAIVSEGVADAATVDLICRNTIGLRLAQMGPIENADYVGLDLTRAIHEAVLPGLDRSTTPDPVLVELVASGHRGAKTGSGYFQWRDGDRQRAGEALAAHVARTLAQRAPHAPMTTAELPED